jgi:hypothetical protein
MQIKNRCQPSYFKNVGRAGLACANVWKTLTVKYLQPGHEMKLFHNALNLKLLAKLISCCANL